jgi:hypothetical protein
MLDYTNKAYYFETSVSKKKGFNPYTTSQFGRHDTYHNNTQLNDTQLNDIQQNDILHNDIQHNDIQHNGIQYNGIQHNNNDTQHDGRALLC